MNLYSDVRRVQLDSINIDLLRDEATREGFQFLDRLTKEWAMKANRFDKAGEELVALFATEQPIAIGGLNRGPYEGNLQVGRLRHIYVLASHRRRGIGRALVEHLINRASGSFKALHLRTDTEDAARFYEKLGFEQVRLKNATHSLCLCQAAQRSLSTVDACAQLHRG